MRVVISVVIHTPNDMTWGSAWNDLVTRAQPNVFMSPAALKAAAETSFAKIHVLVAWQESSPPRLVGLWALQERRSWSLGPTILDSLPFDYAFLSTPVVDPEVTPEVMPAFLNAIAQAQHLPSIVLMQSLATGTASGDALLSSVSARGGRMVILKTENRPVVWRSDRQSLSAERRKKLRQSWKRMSALGLTAVVLAADAGAVNIALEAFLQLELKSWKGAAGTALLSCERDAMFARRLIGNLAANGQAAIYALQIDGQTIASQILLFSGRMAYTWKTAFDEAYAKFSPGVVLIDKLTEPVLTRPGIDGIDSCSVEGSYMGELWPMRQAMTDVIVDIKPGPSLSFRIEAARLLSRERLKTLRDRLRTRWRRRRAK
jgi:CelD/BcsL family acetyltransferase involved in cellulose biosynthesis